MREPGKLEIDKRWISIFVDQHVGFFGKIIVDDARAMNLA